MLRIFYKVTVESSKLKHFKREKINSLASVKLLRIIIAVLKMLNIILIFANNNGLRISYLYSRNKCIC